MNGYELGYSDITSIRDLPLKLNQNTQEYNGPHEQAEVEDVDEIAILIPRDNNPLAE